MINQNSRTSSGSRSSEEAFLRLAELNLTGVLTLTSEGMIVTANDAFLRLVGCAGTQLDSQKARIYDLVAPEFADTLIEMYSILVLRGSAPPTEIELVRDSGERLPVLVSAALFDRPQNHIICLFIDLSELSRTRAALKDTQDRLTRAQEAANIGAFDWDMGTKEVKWSAQVASLREIAPDGKFEQWMQRIHPKDREYVLATFQRLIRDGKTCKTEFRIVKPDATVVWIQSTAQIAYDHEGRPAHTFGVVLDITDRKRSEEELLTAERFSATGRLAATLAHEINNPLTALTNAIYLIQSNDHLPDDLRPHLVTAQDMLIRIGRMTKQMLGFYRGISRPEPVRLDGCIKNLSTVYTQRMSAKGIVFEQEGDAEATVLGFPEQINQLVSNLIENAIDAVDKNGRIRFRIRNRSDWRNPEKRGLQIVVADNGKGVPPNIRPQIFEPFFTTKGNNGTGLGLWVVRGIVEKYDGRINFRTCTRDGRAGTVFSIFLPELALPQSNKRSAIA